MGKRKPKSAIIEDEVEDEVEQEVKDRAPETCPRCGCDHFHVQVTEDDEIELKCYSCDEKYILEF